jgi:hypothetical protein
MSRLVANHADLFDLQPTSQSVSPLADTPTPRIALPSDISASLKYVDDDGLEKLHEAVSLEINRRRSLTQTKSAALSSPPDRRSVLRNKKRELREVPVGQVSLIHASYRAGVKPAAIARSLHVSPALVRHVLGQK